MALFVGSDIGGTFTDFVSYDTSTGQIANWKNLTTPSDPILGIMEGLGKVSALNNIIKARLGTTIATNALLTRRGAKIAYVTTKGFRDVPFIQRGDRRSHYDITWIKTKPLVARADCHEVSERLTAKGEIREALDEQGDPDARESARRWVLSRLEEAHDWEMRCGHDEKIGMAAIGQAFGAVSATSLHDLAPGDARRAFLRCYRAVLQAWQDCDLEGCDSSGRSSIGSAVARLQAGAPDPWRLRLDQEWQAARHGDDRGRRPTPGQPADVGTRRRADRRHLGRKGAVDARQPDDAHHHVPR